jgi:hypothetical protein
LSVEFYAYDLVWFLVKTENGVTIMGNECGNSCKTTNFTKSCREIKKQLKFVKRAIKIINLTEMRRRSTYVDKAASGPKL